MLCFWLDGGIFVCGDGNGASNIPGSVKHNAADEVTDLIPKHNFKLNAVVFRVTLKHNAQILEHNSSV